MGKIRKLSSELAAKWGRHWLTHSAKVKKTNKTPTDSTQAPRPQQPVTAASQMTLVKVKATNAAKTATPFSAAVPHIPDEYTDCSLGGLRNILQSDNLKSATNEAISAAVDLAFADVFAILKTADTPTRSGSDELARTKKSVMAAIWMHKNDYKSFTAGQPERTKLTQETFNEARQYFSFDNQSAERLFTLCCALAANDVGKSDEWTISVATALQEPNLVGKDHDVVLEKAARKRLVSCFEHLAPTERELVIDGLKMGSELNVGALMQGELPAASLQCVMAMKKSLEAFRLKKQEIYLDVAGASLTNEGSSMRESTSRAFITGFKILDSVISEEINIVQAYNKIFEDRAVTLTERGFVKRLNSGASNGPLTIEQPADLALLRILSLGRIVPLAAGDGLNQVKLVETAFNTLPSEILQNLINGLAVTGIDDGKAIVPSMAPEMFVQALASLTKLEDSDQQVSGLQTVMTVLALAFDGTKPQPGTMGSMVVRDLQPLLPFVRNERDEKFTDSPKTLLDAAKLLFLTKK